MMENCGEIDKMSVEKIDVFITNSLLEEGARRIVKSVKPNWKEGDIQVKVFTDGITNRLVGCYLPSDAEDMVLIRVYGEKTELFIDRSMEMRNVKMMHKAGLIPPLYCTFENGICYGYAPGEVLDEEMVRDPIISRYISDMLARMHTIRPLFTRKKNNNNNTDRVVRNLPEEPEPSLFRGIRRFLDLMPTALKDAQQNQRFKMLVPHKTKLEAEVNLLEQHLTELNSPVVFCHNDLLLKNIVYNKTKGKVTFIDFEYADYNYQAFDIGNHFCEFAGVDTFNPSLYPDKAFQIKWLINYLESWYGLTCRKSNITIEREAEILYVQVNKFALAAHLYWSFWALVQAAHSTINFDFLEYSIQRLNEYYAKKDEFLRLKLPSQSITQNGYH